MKYYLFALLGSIFFCLSNFDTGNNPNAYSRLLPVVSLVEDGHLHFNRFAHLTMDKAQIGDNYYSDKAPFTSAIVLPFYFLGQKLFGWQSDAQPHVAVFVIGNILCGFLPFFVWILFLMRRFLEKSPADAPLLNKLLLLFAFSSFPAAYVGTVFGHLWAGVFLILAWLAAEKEKHFWVGVWMGLCFLTEYPMAIIFPFVLFYSLRIVSLKDLASRRTVRHAFLGGLGFGIFLILAFAYNYLLSGNFFKMPYAFVNDPAFSHAKTNYGFRLPSLKAVWALLLGFKRGAFFYAPILFVVLWVALRKLKAGGFNFVEFLKVSKLYELCPAALVLGFLLFLSSYAMWWGGWSYGPRHLIPIFMWLGIFLIPILQKHLQNWRLLYSAAVLGLVSLLVAQLTVGFMIPDHFQYPWIDPMLRHLASGRLNEHNLFLKLLGF